MEMSCDLVQCSYPVVVAMLMRVLAIESAVSPEILTCAIEETFVQVDRQRVCTCKACT